MKFESIWTELYFKGDKTEKYFENISILEFMFLLYVKYL